MTRALLLGAALGLLLSQPSFAAQQQFYPTNIAQPSLLTDCTTTPTGNCPLSALGGFSAGAIIYGGVSSWLTLGPGTSGQVLTSGGAGAPTWTTLSSGTGTVSPATVGQEAVYTATSTVGGVPQACTNAASVNLLPANAAATNDASWTAWAGSLPANGGCIQFGFGTYSFAAASPTAIPLSASVQASVFITGAGNNGTVLQFTNAAVAHGLSITLGNKFQNNFHIRDLTVATTHANVGTGIIVTGTGDGFFNEESDIQNVTVKGADLMTGSPATGTEYWAVAINLINVSNVYANNLNTYGIWVSTGGAGGGVGLEYGGTSPGYATILNVTNSSFNLHVDGWLLQSFWQGVTCSMCNFNGISGSSCISEASGASGTLDLLNINNSQLNCLGVQISAGTQIDDLLVSNNVITATGNGSVGIQGVFVEGTITGNVFNVLSGTTSTGIAILSGSSNGMITGNTFQGFTIGINLASGAGTWNTQSNGFVSVGTPVVNNCGATCKSGGGQP